MEQSVLCSVCVMDFSCSFLYTVFFFSFLFPAAGALLSQSSTAAKLNSQTKHRTRDEKLFMPP